MKIQFESLEEISEFVQDTGLIVAGPSATPTETREAFAKALVAAVNDSGGHRFGYINAIKVYRQMTGDGLAKSKMMIDRFR